MQPQDSYSSPSGNNQYDFIMNSGASSGKPGLTPTAPSSLKKRLLIAGIGGLLLIFIGGAVATFLLNSGPNVIEDTVVIANKQAEIIQIADQGVLKARSSATQQYAITTKLSMITDQNATATYLSKNKKKIDKEALNKLKRSANDKILTTAEQQNRYDEALVSLLHTKLAEYQKATKAAYDIASDKNSKQLLGNLFNHSVILAKN